MHHYTIFAYADSFALAGGCGYAVFGCKKLVNHGGSMHLEYLRTGDLVDAEEYDDLQNPEDMIEALRESDDVEPTVGVIVGTQRKSPRRKGKTATSSPASLDLSPLSALCSLSLSLSYAYTWEQGPGPSLAAGPCCNSTESETESEPSASRRCRDHFVMLCPLPII